MSHNTKPPPWKNTTPGRGTSVDPVGVDPHGDVAGPGVDDPVLGGDVVDVGHRLAPRRHRCARGGRGHPLDGRKGVVERPQHRGYTVVHGLLVGTICFYQK